MTDDLPASPSIDRLALRTADGLDLRAEIARPGVVTSALVVCHPHPLHGGSMHANVVDALFNAMPRLGTAVIRFNFRGVSGSQGRFGGGAAERLDAQAAVGEMHRRWPEAALLLAGYSFGAEVALAVGDPAVAGWLAVAPPLRLLPPEELVALTDQRPKHVVVGAHDQFRSHEELVERFEDAPNTRIVRVDGADHFFTIGLDQIVLAATAALQT